MSPKGENWSKAVEFWKTLYSDKDCKFDNEINIDGKNIENPANQEIVTIRGFMAGEYIVNLLHYKANFVIPLKIKVKIIMMYFRV